MPNLVLLPLSLLFLSSIFLLNDWPWVPDGGRYPDGTVKTVFMDGRQETRYANGRVRIKDADGVITTDDVQVVDPATSS